MNAAGAPGIGKTRILIEFPLHLQKVLFNSEGWNDFADIYISFDNVSNFQTGGEYTENIPPSELIITSLSLRILHSYLNLEKPFSVILSAWRSRFPGIDEYQKVLLDTKNDIQQKRELLKHLTLEIGQCQSLASQKIFLITLLAGTIYTPIEEVLSKSSYSHIRVNLPLLGTKNNIDIISSTKFQSFLENDAFKYALMFVSGWPRLIEVLLETLDNSGKKENFTFQEIRDILVITIETLKRYYKLPEPSLLIPILISWSITSIRVDSWENDRPLSISFTFEQLEEFGIITRSSDGYVAFPLIYIDWKASKINNTPHFTLLYELLHSFEHENFWQNWEIFCSKLLLIKMALFNYLGYNQITLEQLFTSHSRYIQCESGLMNMQISLNYQGSKVIKLDHRFPNIVYNNYFSQQHCFDITQSRVFLNAEGAPFDFFTLSENQNRLKILTAGQSKFKHKDTEGSDLNVTNEVIEEEWFKFGWIVWHGVST
eukprot:gene8348-10253_t